MPSIFHVGAMASCPHQGQVTTVTTNTRVLVNGSFAATAADLFTVAGCTFAPGGAAHPCVTVDWKMPSKRVFVNGAAVILETSAGVGVAADQALQGPATPTVVQKRAQGAP